MHTFKINDLIRFLTFPTCFESHGFIIRKTFYARTFVWYVLHVFM